MGRLSIRGFHCCVLADDPACIEENLENCGHRVFREQRINMVSARGASRDDKYGLVWPINQKVNGP